VLGLLALGAFAFGAAPSLAATPSTPDAAASASAPTYSSGSEYVLIAAQTSVLISTRSAAIARNGDVLIELACMPGATEGCKGAVTIAPRGAPAPGVPAGCGRGCHPLGSARYRARAGLRTRVRVHISLRARRALRRHRAVRVIVTATTVSSGHTTTVDRTIVLRTRPGA
jgi:hypothetical protein